MPTNARLNNTKYIFRPVLNVKQLGSPVVNLNLNALSDSKKDLNVLRKRLWRLIYLSRRKKIKINYDRIRLESIRNNLLLIGPRSITLNIIGRCNYRCKFCISHGPYDNNSKNDVFSRDAVSFPELKKIITQAYSLGVECIIICGEGEPLLHPRIIAILRYLAAHDFTVIVFTNASIDEKIKKIVQLPSFNLSFIVNLSAINPQQYSYIHGQPEERFNHLLKNIKELNNAFPVTLSHLIFEDTEYGFTDYLHLSSSLGVRRIILKFPSLYDFEQMKMSLKKEKMASFLLNLKKMKQLANEYGIRLEYQKHLLNFYFQSCGKKRVKRCYQGWMFARIKVNGSLYFCCNENKPFGRVTKGDFSKAYFSQESLEYFLEGKKKVDVSSPKWRKCSRCFEIDLNSFIDQVI